AVTVLPNSLAIWGLGQAGMIIKGADAVVYIDPYLTGEMPMRAFPTPLRPDHVTNADYILCTHEHMDHFDGGTLAPALAASPNAKIVAPAWCFDRAQKADIDLTRMIPARDTITLPGT